MRLQRSLNLQVAATWAYLQRAIDVSDTPSNLQCNHSNKRVCKITMIHRTASSIIGASWRYVLLSLVVLQERLVLYGGLRDQVGQKSSPATGNLRATRPVPRQELSEIVCCGRLTNCFHAPDHRASSHPRLHLCALPLTSGRNQLLGRITCPRDQTFAGFPRRCFCCQRIRIAT